MFTILFLMALLGTFIMFYTIFSNQFYRYESNTSITAKIQRKNFLITLSSGLISSAIWAYLNHKAPEILVLIRQNPLPIMGDVALLLGTITAVATWCFTLLWIVFTVPDTKRYYATKKQWAN